MVSNQDQDVNEVLRQLQEQVASLQQEKAQKEAYLGKSANLQAFRQFLKYMGIQLRYNEFRGDVDYCIGMDEWQPIKEVTIHQWIDQANKLCKVGGDGESYPPEFTEGRMSSWIVTIATAIRYNPVKDWLLNLPQWDNVNRIDYVLECLFYASIDEKTDGAHLEAIRTASKSMFIDLARRIVNPGCPVPHLVILAGGQGAGKSLLMRKMTPTEEWFNDSTSVAADPKVIIEDMKDALIWECAELNGVYKRDLETVKAFVTRTQDIARPAYARRSEKQRRNWMCYGTANVEGGVIPYDPSGNRRWWIVNVEKKFDGPYIVQWMDEARDFLMAEAFARMGEGEELLNLREDIQMVFTRSANANVRSDDASIAFAEWATNRYTPIGGEYTLTELWEAYSKSENIRTGGAADNIVPSADKVREYVSRHSWNLTACLQADGWGRRATRKKSFWTPPTIEGVTNNGTTDGQEDDDGGSVYTGFGFGPA